MYIFVKSVIRSRIGQQNRMNKTKKERIRKQQEALKLFLAGESRDKICKEVGMSSDTFVRWRKRGEWDKYYEENQTKLSQQSTANVLEEQKRSLQLIRALESIFAEKIQSREIEGFNVTSFSSLQKAKQDILIPKTIKNFNFIKQDNLNISIELRKLLEDTKHGTGI